MKRHHQIAIVVVAAILVAIGIAVPSLIGSADAKASGDTALEDTTIEGEGASGWPEEIVLSASGSYGWEDLPDEVDHAYVTIMPSGFDYDENSGAAIVRKRYQLDGGVEGSATFENVSGDVLSVVAATGWNEEEFMAYEDGSTNTNNISVAVTVDVCTSSNECVSFTDEHEITVIIHNTPDNSSNGGGEPPGQNASVSGDTEMSGYVVVNDDESADEDP